MRLFVDTNLTNAANIVVERIAIRAGGRPNFFLPELGEVFLALVLHDVSGMD